MNHAQWKTRRARRLLGEQVEPSEAYTSAGDAMALGQAVFDRRKELGLSQREVADRAGMTQPQISNIEQAGAEPTLTLLRRLAKALEARLSIDLDDEDSAFVFTPLTEGESTEATPVEEALREVTENVRSHVADVMEQFKVVHTRRPLPLMQLKSTADSPKLTFPTPDPDTFVLLIAAGASLREHRSSVPAPLRKTQMALLRRMMADVLVTDSAEDEDTADTPR